MPGAGRPARKRPDTRLDPVRWRRPGRSTLLRSAAVAGLLATAAMITWSGGDTTRDAACAPGPLVTTVAGPGSSAGGEPDDGRPAVPAGSVGVPVRLAEPTALTLVRPGDRVDLMQVADAGGQPVAVAGAALVLGITNADDPATGGLLLALKPAEAARAVTTAGSGFAILIRPD